MAARFLRIAAIYLAIGVIGGIVMGFSHQFQYAPVHAHLGLLGWASLALAGLIYHLYPAAARTRLARFHFWTHDRLYYRRICAGSQHASGTCENQF